VPLEEKAKRPLEADDEGEAGQEKDLEEEEKDESFTRRYESNRIELN
jgi:hypothetical protein